MSLVASDLNLCCEWTSDVMASFSLPGLIFV